MIANLDIKATVIINIMAYFNIVANISTTVNINAEVNINIMVNPITKSNVDITTCSGTTGSESCSNEKMIITTISRRRMRRMEKNS